jgi:hypothetical protein
VNESQLAREAVRQLRQVGYPVVQTDVSAEGGDRRRTFDIAAYAPGPNGELEPVAVVEVKRRVSRQTLPAALAQLAYAREVLGTHLHYVYDGTWHAADAAFTHVQPVPIPIFREAPGVLALSDREINPTTTDLSIVTRALHALLAARTREPRTPQPGHSSRLSALASLLDELVEGGDLLAEYLPHVQVPHRVLWRAARELVEEVLRSSSSSAGPWLLSAPLRAAMVRLARPEVLFERSTGGGLRGDAGGVIMDPYCGAGLLLCEVMDALLDSDRQPAASHAALYFQGQASDPMLARIAGALLRLAPTPSGFRATVNVDVAEALDNPLGGARILISAPPIGRRLSESRKLWGCSSHDGDLAVVHRCATALASAGRAVLLTSQHWLQAHNADLFRQELARQMHIVALVGLPARVLAPYTSFTPAIAVLAREEPAPSLVADLGKDWAEQLSTGGEFFEAYLGRAVSGSLS